ncbi:hypothetical protein [Cohnella faecalis]|uniref:Uncharacterized protein n=1 Tax=Cohnella faecalis TaxID=2315694 RepID=A0A398CY15_9BACL|nr:hypothetical protein [Cohnella faecalis]RIE03884.1 hypothetical protein D3H35_07905 [Cohnella faecalis]
MTDQSNGLRFDIYERVHLPDEVAAIEELEEIELVPHMQALPQEDEVLLRGICCYPACTNRKIRPESRSWSIGFRSKLHCR